MIEWWLLLNLAILTSDLPSFCVPLWLLWLFLQGCFEWLLNLHFRLFQVSEKAEPGQPDSAPETVGAEGLKKD